MCRESQMGVAAAQRALVACRRWAMGSVDPERDRRGVRLRLHAHRCPTILPPASARCLDEEGKFDFARWGDEGMPQVTPLWLLKYLPNMPASHMAIYNDLRGPNNSLTLREASANAAVGEAFRTIVRGSADVMRGRRHRHPRAPDEDGARRHPGRSGRRRRRAGPGQPAVRSEPQRHGAGRRRRRRSCSKNSNRPSAAAPRSMAKWSARPPAPWPALERRGPPRDGAGQRHAGDAARRRTPTRGRRPPARPRPGHAQLRRGRSPGDSRRCSASAPRVPVDGRQELLRQPGRPAAAWSSWSPACWR